MNIAPWRVELTRAATRDLRRLDAPVRRRVQTALQALAIDPQQPGALRKLTGAPEHRLRIGDWRALLLLDAKGARSPSAASCPAAAPTATDHPPGTLKPRWPAGCISSSPPS